MVIDYSPARVEAARRESALAMQGDASNPAILDRAGVGIARLIVVAVPDLTSAEQITRNAKAMNPRIDILARANDARAIPTSKRPEPRR